MKLLAYEGVDFLPQIGPRTVKIDFSGSLSSWGCCEKIRWGPGQVDPSMIEDLILIPVLNYGYVSFFKVEVLFKD